MDNYNPNNAGTTAEPEYYTPSAESEKDCKDLPKMIPGASREFYNENPSTQQEKMTSPVIAEKETRRSLLEKQAVKFFFLRIVFTVLSSIFEEISLMTFKQTMELFIYIIFGGE